MRYLLDMDDTLRIAQEPEPSILIFGGQRMMEFPINNVISAFFAENIKVDKTFATVLCVTAQDVLLGRTYALLIPKTHKDYGNFLMDFQALLPQFSSLESKTLPPACDENGHHFA